jgi:hypothetical protein
MWISLLHSKALAENFHCMFGGHIIKQNLSTANCGAFQKKEKEKEKTFEMPSFFFCFFSPYNTLWGSSGQHRKKLINK